MQINITGSAQQNLLESDIHLVNGEFLRPLAFKPMSLNPHLQQGHFQHFRKRSMISGTNLFSINSSQIYKVFIEIVLLMNYEIYCGT